MEIRRKEMKSMNGLSSKKGSRGLCFFLSLLLIIANAFAPLGGLGSGPQTSEAASTSYPLVITSVPVAYTPQGGYTDIAIKVKNNSSNKVTGVTLIDSRILGSEDDKWTPYVFQYSNRDGSDKCKDPVNATKDDEGYTIQAGKTATFYLRVYNEGADKGRGLGTFTDTIQLGKRHREYYTTEDSKEGGNWIGRKWVIDATYSPKVKIKNVVYTPGNASLTLGTSNNSGVTIKEFKSIDFGTIDLAKAATSKLKQSKPFYVKNNSPADKDQKGNANNISVEMDLESPYSYYADGMTAKYIFDFDDCLISGASWAPLTPAKEKSFNSARGIVSFDAGKYIAGTYTGTLKVNTVPFGTKVNGVSANFGGAHSISVKVKLTGTNPRIPGKPTAFKAAAGNNQVELTWKAPKGYNKEGLSYTVYRREGQETKTNPDSWTLSDWKKYERISGAEVYAKEDGTFLYVDGTVKNGKTYTYVVISGMPFQGYASTPTVAKPLSKYTSKIQAPERFFADDRPGGVLLEWEMNENYGGKRFNGESLVDHFNIYRDNVLVAQVKQNAVIDEGYYGVVDDGQGGSAYGVTSHNYSWEYFVETPQTARDYTFNVAAVSKAGVEGYWSEPSRRSGDSNTIEIVGHDANYKAYYDESKKKDVPYITAVAQLNSWGDTWESISVWRAEGTTAPTTSGKPLIKENSKGFEDYSITKGKTYTYTMQVTDVLNQKSNFYTFTVKAAPESSYDEHWVDYSSVKVNFSIIGGKKVDINWNASTDAQNNTTGTYKLYCNGKMVKTYTMKKGSDTFISYANDPGKDGTYVYRVDKIINGITVKGKEYTFVRNTKKVDESKLLKPPGTPSLTVRISEGTPVLTWTPSSKGGAVKGYHIYRKDKGKLIENGRDVKLASWYPVNFVPWGNGRYLTIQDSTVTSFVDTMEPAESGGRFGYYLGDTFKGQLVEVNWYEENCPHEYYITAYNDAGESLPSKSFKFEYMGESEEGYPIAPTNEDIGAPGKPAITALRVDWEDNSQTASDGTWDQTVMGHLKVSWEDKGLGGGIDQWKFYVDGFDYPREPSVITFAQAVNDPTVKEGGATQNLGNAYIDGRVGEGSDIGRTLKVVVSAVNQEGETKSKAVNLKVRSFPRMRSYEENNSVKIEWTDLYNDTKTKVAAWEIWRKGEYGGWTKIKTLDATKIAYEKTPGGKVRTDAKGVKNYTWRDNQTSNPKNYPKNGWEYQYKVVAKCSDGKDRASVVRTLKPSPVSGSEAPGKPASLTAKLVNGEIQLDWKAPSTGGAPKYYSIEKYYSGSAGNYWYQVATVPAPSLSYVYKPETSETGTHKFRVCAFNYKNDVRIPDEEHNNYSNVASVKVTSSDIKKQAKAGPGEFALTAVSGIGQVTLNWTASKGATYYGILRNPSMSPGEEIILNSEARKFVDKTPEPGERYVYSVIAYNVYGSCVEEIVARAEGKSHRDEIDEYNYKDVIKPVREKVEALPKNSEITSKNLDAMSKKVAAARKAYNQMKPESLKRLIDITKLEEAERKIAEIKNAQEKVPLPTDPVDPGMPSDPTDPANPVATSKTLRRVYGDSRYETSFAIGDTYMVDSGKVKNYSVLKGTGKPALDAIIVACGTNFPDALAASYLAKVKKAPLIVWREKDNGKVQSYIKANLKSGGRIYIMGGTGVVNSNIAKGLTGYKFTRLGDENRYGTNVKILKAAKVTAGEILVCDGTDFKNALIASATGKPILLVKPTAVTREGLSFIAGLKNPKFTIIGDEKSVAAAVETQLAKYGTVTRVSGSTPDQVSVNVAKKYFNSPKEVIIATGKDYPDGLCGGLLAIQNKAPLMIVTDSQNAKSAAYCIGLKSLERVTALGGEGVVSNDLAKKLLNPGKTKMGIQTIYRAADGTLTVKT